MGDEEKEIQLMSEVENVDDLNGNAKDEVPQIVENEKDGGKLDEEPREEDMDDATMDEDDVATLEKADVEDEKGDAMDEDVNEPNQESEYDVEEEESEDESLKKLVSKRGTKPVKKDNYTKGEARGQKDKEPRTPPPPKTPAIERPQRERKSVDRLVSTFEKAKKFEVEKGLGTALKDIPNVQYNLSKKKWDETIKLLHLTLFARRGQAGKYKTNIARFSGVSWTDNEEKQKIKLKERFGKCARGKLLEFCNILDITSIKSTSKKEDIVAKLVEFLEAPHATRDQLIADKEHGKKRKRVGKKDSSASKGPSSKNSAKKQKKTEKAFKNKKVKKYSISSEDESDEEDEEKTHEETDSGVPEISDDEMSNQTERDVEIDVDESEEEKVKIKKDVKKPSTRKESAGKASKFVSQKSGQAESEMGGESEDEPEEEEEKKKKEPNKLSENKEFAGNAPNEVVLQESGLAESENEERSEDESEVIVKQKGSAREDSADNAAKKVVHQKSDKVEREDSGDELEEEKAKENVSKKSVAKKESTGRTAKKTVPQKYDQAERTDSGDESEAIEKVQEKEPKESPTKRRSSSRPKAKEDTNKSAKGSIQRKDETIKKSSTTKKSTAKETSGKMLTEGKENPKKGTLVPGDDELRDAISNILKEVDLHSATFSDIVEQLVKRFEADLMSKKATIKLMIQDELANQTDESEDDEDEDEDSQEKLSAESVKT